MVVANGADTTTATSDGGIFARTCCDSLTYTFSVSLDQFRFDEFTQGVKAAGGELGGARCSSRDKSFGYHLHANWRRRKKDEFFFQVGFIGKGKEPDEGEGEPFADTFFQWLDQFVLVKEPLRAHVHAEFRYPDSMRNVRYLLLPLKTAIGPKDVEVEIDGFSLSVTPSVQGIERVWITQLPKKLGVYLIGDRPINLKTFDVANEISALSGVVNTLLGEEVKQ